MAEAWQSNRAFQLFQVRYELSLALWRSVCHLTNHRLNTISLHRIKLGSMKPSCPALFLCGLFCLEETFMLSTWMVLCLLKKKYKMGIPEKWKNLSSPYVLHFLFANSRNMLLSQLVCRVQLLLYSVLLLIL